MPPAQALGRYLLQQFVTFEAHLHPPRQWPMREREYSVQWVTGIDVKQRRRIKLGIKRRNAGRQYAVDQHQSQH